MEEKTVLNEKLYTYKLENGLDVFIMEKKGFTKKFAILATNYGSNDLKYINPFTKNEIELHHGVAHFLEHKMFEMPNGEDVFKKFSYYGASPNAYTNFNMTAYHFSCVNNFKECLSHLIDYVYTPYFTDENVEKEKGIIAQEIKMYDDNPNFKVFFNALKAMYKVHPNSIDIAGTVDSIYKITKEELYNAYNTFYSPKNMALFIVGDINKESTLETINTSFKLLENKNSNMKKMNFTGSIERIFENEDDTLREKEISEKSEVSLSLFVIGFKEKLSSINRFKENEEKYKFENLKKEIVFEIIGDSIFKSASCLNDKLYNLSLIYEDLYAEYSRHKDYGYFTIEGETNNFPRLKDEILKEINKFKKDGISVEDLNRIKKYKKGVFVKIFDFIESIGNMYISSYFKGYDMFDYEKVLNSITKEDVDFYIRDIFNEEMMVVSTVNPK